MWKASWFNYSIKTWESKIDVLCFVFPLNEGVCCSDIVKVIQCESVFKNSINHRYRHFKANVTSLCNWKGGTDTPSPPQDLWSCLIFLNCLAGLQRVPAGHAAWPRRATSQWQEKELSTLWPLLCVATHRRLARVPGFLCRWAWGPIWAQGSGIGWRVALNCPMV